MFIMEVMMLSLSLYVSSSLYYSYVLANFKDVAKVQQRRCEFEYAAVYATENARYSVFFMIPCWWKMLVIRTVEAYQPQLVLPHYELVNQ
ncbi:hypothetical protein Bca4012_084429 [Brassica carinata]